LIKGGDPSLKNEEESFVIEMERYITCVNALLKLIEVSQIIERPTVCQTGML